MKVAHLTSVHRVGDTRILHRECAALAAAGHDVVLVAAHEGEPPPSPVRVHAVPRRRGRVARFTRTTWDVWRAARQERADVYHFHDPELIGVGLLLKLRGRVVYDAHEDVPRQLRGKPWIPRLLHRPLGAVVAGAEAVAGRAFDGVVAATDVIARRFPEKKSVVVQNFPVLAEVAPADAPPYASREPVVAYVGSVTRSRGAVEMAQAVARLPPLLRARLVVAGPCDPPALADEVRAIAGPATELLGWQDRAGVARLLARARVGLATLHPLDNYREAQPVKLFEYMAAGVPVVASDFPRWRRIVDDAGCGFLVDPLDPGAIAGAIGRLLTDPAKAEEMGRRGAQAAREKYSWDAEAQKLVALYDRLGAR